MPPPTSFSSFAFLLLFLLLSSAAAASRTHFSTATIPRPTATGTSRESPLTPKASLLRYWSRKIPNNLPKPAFLLSKASPLSAPDAALYERLAASGSLLPRLRPFCSAARLLCFPDLNPELDRKGSSGSFTSYEFSNFTNYGTGKTGGLSSFTNYSDDQNVPLDTFRRYSRDSTSHDDRFAFYAPNGNVVTANFTSYATSATGGHGDFSAYDKFSNVPDLKFTNYDAVARGRLQTFSSYSDDANAGDQSFSGYGKSSTTTPTTFSTYGKNTNVVGSTFSNYGESATSPNDTFTSYAFDTNVPKNTFSSYADGAKGAISQSFASYREQANVGDDSFQSYAKHTTKAHVEFGNYGQSANVGTDTFKGYGKGDAVDPTITFKTYGPNTTFLDYTKAVGASVTFADYRNTTSSQFANLAAVSDGVRSGRLANRWVEPGKFFRESQLQTGTVMPMPDISDKLPARTFLPRSIAVHMPFSSPRIGELGRLFNATADTALWKGMVDTVTECERPPSRDETKQCATSVEDMIDFATSMLGSDVVVRSTESTNGYGGDVEIGKVRGINGGRVTRSVSCHQSLFPYMVYYCHSVPKVRVYEAEILAVGSREVINHGVAICHLDTSAWSEGHGAFVALGPGPGKIEVCHWIFQGDMTWATAD